MTTLDPFYPIVDDADWVARVVAAGVRLVQLRMKDLSADEIRNGIAKARDVCAAAGAQLVVNDFWQEAIEAGCDYVHLGQSDLDTADIGALRAANVKIGISTHDHAELARALALKPDYIALGPVYPTLLKIMPWSPQGLARVSEWKTAIGAIPLIGIGGITVARARGVLEAGADCAAVVTDIVKADDPEARIAEWIAATQPL